MKQLYVSDRIKGEVLAIPYDETNSKSIYRRSVWCHDGRKFDKRGMIAVGQRIALGLTFVS